MNLGKAYKKTNIYKTAQGFKPSRKLAHLVDVKDQSEFKVDELEVYAVNFIY